MTERASTTGQGSRSAVARRTRRQLLAGGTGALAAVLTAEALTRPAPAAAANGDPVLLGQDNTETSPTTITNSTAGAIALVGSASGDHSIGLLGGASGPDSAGVSGQNDSGPGVQGISNTGAGVAGLSNSTGTGVFGQSISGVGVAGSSDGGTGVSGGSTTGTAVSGESSGIGPAVHGKNIQFGTGVAGECAGGTGVRASGKTALHVQGPAVFSRSGKLTIAAGKTSATQTGVPLTSASLVLVTPQNDVSGVAVRSAVPNVPAGSFTVHLAKAVRHKVTVGWFVVN